MPIVTPIPTPENPSITTTFAAQPSPTTTAIATTAVDDSDDGGTGNPTFDAAGNAIGGAFDAAGNVVESLGNDLGLGGILR